MPIAELDVQIKRAQYAARLQTIDDLNARANAECRRPTPTFEEALDRLGLVERPVLELERLVGKLAIGNKPAARALIRHILKSKAFSSAERMALDAAIAVIDA